MRSGRKGYKMFLGTFEPSVLEKRRLVLPKKIRAEIKGERVVLTIGFEKCIFGFEEASWNSVVAPELSKPFFSDSEARNMRRKLGMNAAVTTLDAQGRMVIPEHMMQYAGITNNVIMIGAGDHFEMWNRDIFKEYSEHL